MIAKDGQISFKSIPGAISGETSLTIYKPGAWMNRPYYHALVGGNGVGTAETLEGAKELLLLKAKSRCMREIIEGQKRVNHYLEQLAKLEANGLEPEVDG